MAQLRIGNYTFHIGDKIERSVSGLALPILLTLTEKWICCADLVLPEDHPSMVAMTELAGELRNKIRETK
jgi:hypothetical protein